MSDESISGSDPDLDPDLEQEDMEEEEEEDEEEAAMEEDNDGDDEEDLLDESGKWMGWSLCIQLLNKNVVTNFGEWRCKGWSFSRDW